MATFDQELIEVRGVLQADGYDLQIGELEGGLLRLTVIAGENACEECLMPKDIMVSWVQDALQSRPEVRRVEVCYPHE